MSKRSIFETVYLNKDALKKEILSISTSPLNEWDTWGVLNAIDRVEPADVAPVVHAHWETDKHAALDFCSSCGEAVERYVTAEQMDKSNYKGATYWNYCPHCGAKMDEEVQDNGEMGKS